MISSRKQQNVEQTVEALRGEGLDVRGVACHIGKLEAVIALVKVAPVILSDPAERLATEANSHPGTT